MALARADLIAAIAGEQAGVLALAGLTPADDAVNLKGPIDRTLRALGTAEADLGSAVVPDGAEARAIAYATYFVLDRAAASLVGRVDVVVGKQEASAKESQAFVQVRQLAEHALVIAQSYGLTIGDGQAAIIPMPFAGGISKGDYETRQEDSDRVPPLFQTADLEPSRRDTPLPEWGQPW